MNQNQKLLVVIIVVLICILSLLFFQFKAYDTYTNSIQKSKQMRLIAKDIRYLDEVLTMSARMAAYTGEKQWIQRYNKHVILLDKQFFLAKQDKDISQAISLTDIANNQLVSIELKSFYLISQNRLKEAQDLLNGIKYKIFKDEYSKGLKKTIDLINDKSLEIIKIQTNHYKNSIFIALVLFILIILIGVFIGNILRKNALTLEKRVDEELQSNREKDMQLFQSAKMSAIGEMIGNIAHQWRQPLSAISMVSNNLLADIDFEKLEEKEVKKGMKDILKQTKHLSNTIDTFRDFIKPNHIHQKAIIQETIETSLNIISISLKNHQIKLKKNLKQIAPIEIKTYPNELAQVIINIINNSKDALIEKKHKDKWIAIDLDKDEHTLFITIEDNGGGIDESIMNKIFEPYFTTKHKSQGTGLGLHMSYKIVTERLKGRLLAQNTDKGAKFIIELPLN